MCLEILGVSNQELGVNHRRERFRRKVATNEWSAELTFRFRCSSRLLSLKGREIALDLIILVDLALDIVVNADKFLRSS